MAEASVKAIQEAKSGILCFGNSTHFSSHIIINDETIVRIAAGSQQSAVVCKSGRVFTIGDNRYNENDPRDVRHGFKKPNLVTDLHSVEIVNAACGNHFTCFLSATGELYTCGSNSYGQLGSGNNTDRSSPIKVNGIPQIKKVVAGAGHVVALAVNGDVWVAGYNAQGQLGLDHCINQSSMTHVSTIRTIISDVSCGSYHTALLSANGVLYVTGSNRYGVLGLGDICDLSMVQAVPLPSAVAIAAIACGADHTVVLTVEGTVWAWGQNYYGQLGIGDQFEVSYTPKAMVRLENYFITKVLAGAEHTALITDEGNILVCGSGGEGELGNKDKKDIYLPTRFPLALPQDLNVKQVVCSYNATLLLIGGTEHSQFENLPEVAEVAVENEYLGPSITDWERSIMSTLECPICFKIMCAPIHQCTKGHNFCNSCHNRNTSHECCLCREPFIGTRNMALEGLGDSLQLPCSDCLLRLPVPLLEKHGYVCPRRAFGCPLLKSCGWTGRPAGMLSHVTSKHSKQTWQNLPHEFVYKLNEGLVSNVIAAHGAVFTLHRKFDNATGFRAVLKFFGTLKKDEGYEFKLEFTTKASDGSTIRLIFNRDVCVETDNVNDMLNSEKCIELKRKNFALFFHNHQVCCSADISLKKLTKNQATS